MPLAWQASRLQMGWCLECHRHPERYIRPREEVFTMGYVPAIDQAVMGPKLVAEYGLRSRRVLESCTTCHR
jgi:hypothetical protein